MPSIRLRIGSGGRMLGAGLGAEDRVGRRLADPREGLCAPSPVTVLWQVTRGFWERTGGSQCP